MVWGTANLDPEVLREGCVWPLGQEVWQNPAALDKDDWEKVVI